MATLDLTNQRILVTGGAGFLGRLVIEQLCTAGAKREKITVPRSRDYDLRSLEACQQVVQQQDIVIHLAAHVGGIGLNREKPAELYYDNLMMGTQLIHRLSIRCSEVRLCGHHLRPILNSRQSRLKKMTSGMAIRRKQTPPMALPKKLS
jgi:hypothetical protein